MNKNQRFPQKENKNEHQNEPKIMITTPIFFNNIPNYCYNKMGKKKIKPFVERKGDWVCKKCKNLNFAFRQECNRCKISKKEAMEIEEKKEEMIKEQKNFEIIKVENNDNSNNKSYYNYNNNTYHQYNKKNKFRFRK